MRNIILFGAGAGSKNYAQACKDNILAIADNNSGRVGETIDSIPIIAPSSIGNYAFDNIVITSQWAEDIKLQLVNELGIPISDIEVPAKFELKGKAPAFSDPATLELANNILKSLCDSAYKNSIELYIDFGTLLGVARDNTVMPWDDDIDFAITKIPDQTFLNWLTQWRTSHHLPVTFEVETRKDKHDDFIDFVLKFSHPDYQSFLTTICYRKEVDGQSLHMPSLGQWFAPQVHFSSPDYIEWQGINVQVPHDYENYLEFVYGDWKTPKKNMSMTDYANLNELNHEDVTAMGMVSETIK